MRDDRQLLANYAEGKSEAAFEELVGRYINLVHSAAGRQLGDPDLAQDVTQTVFLLLARKARRLPTGVNLAGWLYRTTRYVAADALKQRRRRQIREQEAHMQTALTTSDNGWEQMAPVLDEAMAELGEGDRDAVVLRFFQDKSIREVSGVLGIQERAAQKRITRAVERLRDSFMKRGLPLTSASLAAALSTYAVQAAPPGLTSVVSAKVFAAGTIIQTSTLFNGAMKLMAWSNTKIAAGALLVAAILVIPTLVQHQSNQRLRAENAALRQQLAAPIAVTETSPGVAIGKRDTDEHTELLRLRNEVGRLRAQRQEPNQGRPQAPTEVPTPPPQDAPDRLPKETWINAGFATPEAALQTRGWAVLNADRQRFKESLHITDDGRNMMETLLEQMIAAAPDPERQRQWIRDNGLTPEDGLLLPMMALNKNGALAAYQIVARHPAGPDEVVLDVATEMLTGVAHQESMKFRRIDDSWKVVIDETALRQNLKLGAK